MKKDICNETCGRTKMTPAIRIEKLDLPEEITKIVEKFISEEYDITKCLEEIEVKLEKFEQKRNNNTSSNTENANKVTQKASITQKVVIQRETEKENSLSFVEAKNLFSKLLVLLVSIIRAASKLNIPEILNDFGKVVDEESLNGLVCFLEKNLKQDPNISCRIIDRIFDDEKLEELLKKNLQSGLPLLHNFFKEGFEQKEVSIPNVTVEKKPKNQKNKEILILKVKQILLENRSATTAEIITKFKHFLEEMKVELSPVEIVNIVFKSSREK